MGLASALLGLLASTLIEATPRSCECGSQVWMTCERGWDCVGRRLGKELNDQLPPPSHPLHAVHEPCHLLHCRGRGGGGGNLGQEAEGAAAGGTGGGGGTGGSVGAGRAQASARQGVHIDHRRAEGNLLPEGRKKGRAGRVRQLGWPGGRKPLPANACTSITDGLKAIYFQKVVGRLALTHHDHTS